MRADHEKIEQLEALLYIQIKHKRYRDAERLIKDALKDLGPSATIYNLLGLTYSHQSRFDDAIDNYQKALHLDNAHTEAAINLAITYCDLGLYDLAQAIYEEHTSTEATRSQVNLKHLAEQHSKTAQAYKYSGQFQRACSELETAISLCPHIPKIYLDLATLCLKTGDFELAKRTLKSYLSRFKSDASAHNLLGLVAYHEGDVAESRHHWEKSQKLSPEDRASKLLLRSSKSVMPSESL